MFRACLIERLWLTRSARLRAPPLLKGRLEICTPLCVSIIYIATRVPIGVNRQKAGNEATSLRSEEHTSELQSLMRISYAAFCLKKKKKTQVYSSKTH